MTKKNVKKKSETMSKEKKSKNMERLRMIEETLEHAHFLIDDSWILLYYSDAKKITGEISCTSRHCDGKELDDSCIIVFRVLTTLERVPPSDTIEIFDEVSYMCDVDAYCNRCRSHIYVNSEKTLGEQVDEILESYKTRGFYDVELPEFFSIPYVQGQHNLIVDISRQELIEPRSSIFFQDARKLHDLMRHINPR